MTTNGWLQLALYVVVLLALAKPLGAYMARVYEGQPALLNRLGAPLERVLYKACGIDPNKEMHWIEYALAALAFNIVGLVVVYALQRLQHWIPFLNPQDMAAVSPDSAFNTAVSFATNTNWQGYGGESTMSYLTQMLGLTVQNFVSAATGMAVLIALIRGFQRASSLDDRQFLGRPDAHDALHPAAPVTRARGRTGLARRRADVLALHDGAARAAGRLRQSQARCGRPGAEGRQGQSGHRAGDGARADDRGRTRGVAGRDQAARH